MSHALTPPPQTAKRSLVCPDAPYRLSRGEIKTFSDGSLSFIKRLCFSNVIICTPPSSPSRSSFLADYVFLTPDRGIDQSQRTPPPIDHRRRPTKLKLPSP